MKPKNTKSYKKISKHFTSNKLNGIEKEISNWKKEENDVVFANIKEMSSNLTRAYEHLYMSEIQGIDVAINIVLNFISFSLALITMIIAIPNLNANWKIIAPPLLFGFIMLISLTFYRYRKRKSNELTYKLISGILLDTKRLLKRTEDDFESLKNKAEVISRSLLKTKNAKKITKSKFA